jgi:hypothetical protein
MNRRDFLSIIGISVGSVLIPAPVARLIHDTCVLQEKPLITPPASLHRSTIYAIREYRDYTLHYGDPDQEPDVPTWREFAEDRGVDLDDPEDRLAFIEEFFSWCPSDGTRKPRIPLNSPITGCALDHYLEWDYELRESPMALAYSYLSNLPLCNSQQGIAGNSLGRLSFVEGDRPGSNLTYVRAPDFATLACLQHRLNELNTDVRIKIKKS